MEQCALRQGLQMNMNMFNEALPLKYVCAFTQSYIVEYLFQVVVEHHNIDGVIKWPNKLMHTEN